MEVFKESYMLPGIKPGVFLGTVQALVCCYFLNYKKLILNEKFYYHENNI